MKNVLAIGWSLVRVAALSLATSAYVACEDEGDGVDLSAFLLSARECPTIDGGAPASWPASPVVYVGWGPPVDHFRAQFWVATSREQFDALLDAPESARDDVFVSFSATDFTQRDVWMIVAPANCRTTESASGSQISNLVSPSGEVHTQVEFFLPDMLVAREPESTCGGSGTIGAIMSVPKGTEPRLCVMGFGDGRGTRGRLRVYEQGTTELFPQVP